MTDYELEYQRNEAACGQAFPEFVRFLEGLPGASTVLDLGAGQGRDALVAARAGHHVVAVDIAPTGIGQILAVAKREKLSVEGVVADLREYRPNRGFDVVILDRVVHMLREPDDKMALLSMAARATAVHGHVLVADTPGNQQYIDRQFADPEAWEETRAGKGRRIFRRTGSVA